MFWSLLNLAGNAFVIFCTYMVWRNCQRLERLIRDGKAEGR